LHPTRFSKICANELAIPKEDQFDAGLESRFGQSQQLGYLPEKSGIGIPGPIQKILGT